MRSREEIEKVTKSLITTVQQKLHTELLLDIRDLLQDKRPKVSQVIVKTSGKLTEKDIAEIRKAVKGAQS